LAAVLLHRCALKEPVDLRQGQEIALADLVVQKQPAPKSRLGIVHPENIASQRVLEKAGFTLEGLLRRHDREGGRYVDCRYYAILRHEWRPARLPDRISG